ncbi:sensor histidine kinase [Nocardioides marmoriginsengisoli]|uniref:histidine kinase n=1 Tax=Nocardioides marmoriginsengisoli TaxID=661483 RepID=A0A3N0CAV3_9ACTN|nr:HAMP domain-containing sensor histidine kinase [Nocardioides marmoriginsengisoli]RNL60604.1 sensor histidine kinase [Nocardioides marmoriginsengisoli]
MTTTSATTTAAGATMTTEGARPGHALTVRTRITATVAVLGALALSVAGVLVYLLESGRIDERVNDRITQEVAELRVFEETSVDPDTGRRISDADRLIEVFLTRNVPDEDELLVHYAAGKPAFRSPHEDAEELLAAPAYRQAVAGILERGGNVEVDISGLGEVWVTTVPVVDTRSSGSMAIVHFLDSDRAELSSTMRTYAVVAGIALILMIAVAAVYSGRLLAPLRVLRSTAQEINATDLSRRIPVRGQDDIAALTSTVNAMLDRLEAGFATQREFLDDAGHELKTPLTILRGHLELLDPADAAEVDETRVLLLDEVDRMSRLVEDLILLAKSERPDFLAPAPTDVATLLESVRAKASALGDRDWVTETDAAGEAVVDEQRITQAVLQLAANAVKHSEDGSRIVLGAWVRGNELQLWVRDRGAGVPELDRQRVFERFGRSTGSPDDDGFGLGLSIVRAIAEAHGGRAWVEDAVPGARFVIAVPWVRRDASDAEQTLIIPVPESEDRTWLGS